MNIFYELDATSNIILFAGTEVHVSLSMDENYSLPGQFMNRQKRIVTDVKCVRQVMCVIFLFLTILMRY